MAERDYGFIDFGSGHSSIIASASMEDGDNLGGMTLIGTDAGSEVYANGGITFTTVLGITYTPSAPEKLLLEVGGHLRIDVESTFLDIANTFGSGNQMLMGIVASSGNPICIYKPTSSAFVRVADFIGPTSTGTLARIESDTKGGFSEVVLSWYGNTVSMYVDKLLVSEINDAKITPAILNTARAGAIANGTSGPNGFIGKNFHVSTQPINTHIPYGMSHIALIGHSFSESMDYGSTNSQIVGDRTQGATGDITGLSNLHRRLAVHGWDIPQGLIRNEGVGGAVLAGYTAQITNLLTKVTHLDVVICQMGTNDAANPIAGTYQADYQVHLDRLIAAGARTIILINTITRNTNPTFSSAVYEGRVDELNVIHDALVAANSECHLVDAFTKFGGHDNWLSSDVNQAAPTHPNDVGYTKIANWTADVLVPLIAAT